MLLILVRVILFVKSSIQLLSAYTRLVLPLIVLGIGLSGCSGFSMTSLPSFGFGGSSGSQSPDCSEIEKRMGHAHKKYARALGREKPSIYLTFTGNLSRTMKRNRLRGVHEMSDIHLDNVVDRTQQACQIGHLSRSVCRGAGRLGAAYKPLVLAAREAHENYCGNRQIR